MKLSLCTFPFIILSIEAFAFDVRLPTKPNHHFGLQASASREEIGMEATYKTMSSIFTGIFLAANVMTVNNAPAFATPTNIAMDSSSIRITKTVTTMDMSLPGSYDSISGAKASGTDELTVETNVLTNTSRKKVSSSDSKDKVADLAERKAQREALAAEKAALAAEKEAEKEALTAEKAAEREALALQKVQENELKAQEKAEAKAKATAKKEKETAERKLAGAEFVDMSLPSYGDNASASGGKSSIFSL